MKFDFKYPIGLIGFHSGWSNNDFPTHRLSLTARLNINLKVSDYSIIKIIKNIEIPPFMIKNKKGKIKGLSSGVGSSLIKYKGRVFKIKRNGFKYRGFIRNKIFDRDFKVKYKNLYEETEFETGGCLSLGDAKREIFIEKKLEKEGFIIPHKTVALYKIKNISKKDAVALIQEVKSDFRVDEFVMVLLCNLLYDIFKDKMKIRIATGDFIFPSYSIKKGLNVFKKYKNLFYLVGKNIGVIYRKLHDKGFIRGISNSWYGNEILLEDGNIGLCDLESSFCKNELGSEEVFRELCKTDINLALTAFYDSMNFFENSIASFVGSTLIEGFKEGYKNKNYGLIKKEDIFKNLKKFFKIKNKIIKNE